jgi:AP-1 complex subunit beta-1
MKKPGQAQELVQKVLQNASTHGESADLRDRAYIYWRLLSADANVAKSIVLAEKPTIKEDQTALHANLLNELLRYIGTIASVYHKPPNSFLTGKTVRVDQKNEAEEINEMVHNEDLLNLGLDFAAAPQGENGGNDVFNINAASSYGGAGDTGGNSSGLDFWTSEFGNGPTSPPPSNYGQQFQQSPASNYGQQFQQSAPSNYGQPFQQSSSPSFGQPFHQPQQFGSASSQQSKKTPANNNDLLDLL